MHAASRNSLEQAVARLDTLLASDESVAAANEIGAEIFDCVDVLAANRPLRMAVADNSATGEKRAQLVRDVFSGKVRKETVAVLVTVAENSWSSPRQLRDGLVELGRRALLKGAEREGKLEKVERELFELSRLLDREVALTQLLTDRRATSDDRRQLLGNVLYGKVTSTTEALALQAIGRPTKDPVEDLRALSDLAAATRGKHIASVTSAVELTESQRDTLSDKLSRIYGVDVAVHAEVDPSLLGGMVVRFGSEIIDGSTRGKLERLRSAIA